MRRNRNAVITGANHGIGFEVVSSLYLNGNHVIVGSQDRSKNEVCQHLLQKQHGGKIKYLQLDLEDEKSIYEFVLKVQEQFKQIDILINNYAIINRKGKSISDINVEKTLTVNHFGHFYLTYLLMKNLAQAKQCRIINVGSSAHYVAPQNLFSDLYFDKTRFDAEEVFCQSKMFNVLFTVGLKQFFQNHNLWNIKAVCLHPGAQSEENFPIRRQRTNFSTWFQNCFSTCNGETESKVQTNHFYELCTSPFQKLKNGQYYEDSLQSKEMDPRGKDLENVDKLWSISEKAYGISFESYDNVYQ